jgi:hypothetical protein
VHGKVLNQFCKGFYIKDLIFFYSTNSDTSFVKSVRNVAHQANIFTQKALHKVRQFFVLCSKKTKNFCISKGLVFQKALKYFFMYKSVGSQFFFVTINGCLYAGICHFQLAIISRVLVEWPCGNIHKPCCTPSRQGLGGFLTEVSGK